MKSLLLIILLGFTLSTNAEDKLKTAVVIKIESPTVASTSDFPYSSVTVSHLQNLLTKRVTLLPDDTPIIIIYNTQKITYAFVEQVLSMPPEEFKRELRRNTRGPIIYLASDSQVLRRLTDSSIGIIEDIQEAQSRRGRDVRELEVITPRDLKHRDTLDEKSD